METKEPTSITSPEYMTTLSRTFASIQDQRIRTVLRIKAQVRAKTLTKEEAKRLINNLDTRLKADEKSIKLDMAKALKSVPVWQGWFQHVYGLGPILSGGIIGEMKNIERFPHISNLWSWSGLGIHNGEADKRISGHPSSWNQHMKALCWKLGVSFTRRGKFFAARYTEFKADEEKKNIPWTAPFEKDDLVGFKLDDPDCGLLTLDPKETPPRTPGINITKDNVDRLLKNADAAKLDEIVIRRTDGHVDNRAKRRNVKLFLGVLWMFWTELEGLPASEPYAGQLLGHQTTTPCEVLVYEARL